MAEKATPVPVTMAAGKVPNWHEDLAAKYSFRMIFGGSCLLSAAAIPEYPSSN